MTREQYIKEKLSEPNTYETGYVAFSDLLGFSNLCLNEPCEIIKAIIDDVNLMKYDYIYSFSRLIIPPEVINATGIRLVSDRHLRTMITVCCLFFISVLYCISDY